MKKKIAYVLSLVLVLSIGFSVGAIASNGTKTATLFYRDIKITLPSNLTTIALFGLTVSQTYPP